MQPTFGITIKAVHDVHRGRYIASMNRRHQQPYSLHQRAPVLHLPGIQPPLATTLTIQQTPLRISPTIQSYQLLPPPLSWLNACAGPDAVLVAGSSLMICQRKFTVGSTPTRPTSRFEHKTPALPQQAFSLADPMPAPNPLLENRFLFPNHTPNTQKLLLVYNRFPSP